MPLTPLFTSNNPFPQALSLPPLGFRRYRLVPGKGVCGGGDVGKAMNRATYLRHQQR